MPQKRVVLFNNAMAPYTSRLWSALADRFDVRVCSCAKQEDNRDWANDFENGFPHAVLKGFCLRLGPARFAHFNIGFLTRIVRFRPALVICNGFYPTMVGVALCCMLLRIPYVIQNDGWAQTMPATLYHTIFRSLLLRRSRGVIACSIKGGAYFQAHGLPAASTFVVPLAPAWDAPSIAPGYDERPYDLLWVAHMNTSVKNCLFFVHVVDLMRQRRPGLHICVVGDGPQREAMLSDLGAMDIRVTACKTLRWNAMAPVFGSSRLLLLPSLWEPWGLVCNEAMQCGTPCIVSPHVGAAGELVTDNAGMIAALDPVVWADACEHLLEPARWADHSRHARIRAQRHDFAHYHDGYVRAIEAFARSDADT